jgi:hypothetical protein
MLRWSLLWVPLFFGFCVHGQVKTMPAVKAATEPRIDGLLDDESWKGAPLATNFVQNFPTFGEPATTRTEVRVLYDDEAVYIGARLYDERGNIRRQLTARDNEQRQDVDYFAVFLDTYNDQQNGFQFLVTSTNVQSDLKLNPAGGSGFGDYGDRSWDAVWQSQTTIGADGWTAELRIPYISLRFAKKDIQTWGLQFLRFTRRNNESSFWNPVNPNVNGFANQFGKLEGLNQIRPPLRLSFSPYLSTGVRSNPEGSRIGTQWLRSGGMDVKYGLNESFTLDATLIPDFGQVISDNVVNNLTPFEVFFQENRPFFTEGTELFNKSNLFYSRRVGAQPGLYGDVEQFARQNPNYTLLSNPSVTQLYNAIKFSGRTRKKLGIGVFNAVTAPMRARLQETSSKQDTLIQTEPLTNYNVVVIDQALKGRSSITFTNTNVARKGPDRDANVTAFDWSLFTNDNLYRFQGTARYSKIFGFTPYYGDEINLYYDTVRRNGELFVKPYDGFNTTVRFAKVGGRLQFYAQNNITSNTYDPNDLGYLQTANVVDYSAGISFNEFTPRGSFLQYRYSIDVRNRNLFKPYRFIETEITARAFWYFTNFWDLSVSVSTFPTAQNDYFELRTPGRFLTRPREMTFRVNGSSDSRKRLFFSFEAAYAPRAKGDNNYNQQEAGLRYRFSDRFLMSINYFRQFENNQIGYAFRREANGEPIVGYRDFKESVGTITGNYSFTSRINLSLRARHYWNWLRYNSFYNVDGAGRHLPRAFIPNQVVNYNAFNLDAFFTWDFRYGSRIVLGWKNWLGNNFAVDRTRYSSYLGNLGQIFGASHGNEITARVIFFLDYNSLRKK